MNFLPKGFIDIITEDGTLQYFEQYSDVKIDEVIEGIKWRNDSITLYGKTFPQPRLTAWYGDSGVKYSYSNIHMQALPWTPILLKLKTQLENDLNARFNSVLVNYYRDGNDHMSYHSDDEKELGPNPTIASLSFGETRSFQLKHKFDLEKKTVIIPITDGSLVVMKDELQHFWQHKITKTKKLIGPRVNLTFRMIY
ncbi:alpha-ketoglutarate-dependent dioxygenase AlkB [Bacteriovorax stolpii]|uniref:alpha-ketoglutarate-dependent dioxygenase AlkB family protein n=1 Tax=Bacteriovorax stolpii TaxID=960 RepID=UPI0011570AF5|nr:alpha-ketoglutarate-dependent dioxygenase AlkB [Bacteriovorax stolpii]QDK42887.1 alpha-ketoglutarate-dependent dioxygenase AlkB [Bacteriovorax stolpii]